MRGHYSPSSEGAGSADAAIAMIQRLEALRNIAWNARPGSPEYERAEVDGPERAALEKLLWEGPAENSPLMCWRLQQVMDGIRSGESDSYFDEMLLASIADMLALVRKGR